jgi:hypothetical protein
MDTIETLGSTEYAMTRVMIRIDSISTAKTAVEALYRFAAVTGYTTATADMNAVPQQALAILRDLTEAAYDAHPLAIGKARDFES